MIKVDTKIHDKFSIEFKVSFLPQNKSCSNNFKTNTWIFIPNSLDINPSTYGKDQFYRDMKSNIRLVTPQFLLNDIIGNGSIPFEKFKKSVEKYINKPTEENKIKYEYHTKMFAAICHSSIRNSTNKITSSKKSRSTIHLCEEFIQNLENITQKYRNFIHKSEFKNKEARHPLRFTDEYLSQIFDIYVYKVIRKIKRSLKKIRSKETYSKETYKDFYDVYARIKTFLINEKIYKKANNHFYIKSNDDDNNRYVIFRHGALKKFVESDMYIELNKKEDGFAIRQIFYGIAAGLAMIFATIIAFSFKWKFGSVSTQLFIALVISYIFKDRIKELTRYYFSNKLSTRFYDDKANINISHDKVGWIKESVDFTKEKNMPKEVISLRNRSSLLEYENEIFNEKIIFYRKRVFLDGKELAKHSTYKTNGVTDIMRLYMNRFIQKTDNPTVNMNFINDEYDIDSTKTQKIYYINVIMQFIYNDQEEYKRFRIVLVRSGILSIQSDEEINSCII